MDIVGKETLEDILKEYSGTLIFVSHDRYFINKVATKVLLFEEGKTELYPYGYEQYLQKQKQNTVIEQKPISTAVKEKKTYTTPAKEKAKRERAIKKCEEKIADLESKLANIEAELLKEENISDYIKLGELQNEQMMLESELNSVLEEWEKLSEEELSAQA